VRRLVLAMVLLALSAPVSASNVRVDPIKVRRELRQILASPEYNQVAKPNLIEKWMGQVGTWVGNGIQKFFKWVIGHLSFGDGSGASVIATLAAWTMALGFVVLVGWVIKKLVDGAHGQARVDESVGEASYEMPSAKLLIKQAAKLAESGDYRGAFRAAYLASIAYLDECRALRFERSRTNWEYLRELKQGGHEKPHGELQPLTADFDRKIYGRENCEREDYLNAAGVYDRLSSEDRG
jgi:hypothetical protein